MFKASQHLGYSYLFRAKALFIYLSVAETGFEVAQYNTAFLCEADDVSGRCSKISCVEDAWRHRLFLIFYDRQAS